MRTTAPHFSSTRTESRGTGLGLARAPPLPALRGPMASSGGMTDELRYALRAKHRLVEQ